MELLRREDYATERANNSRPGRQGEEAAEPIVVANKKSKGKETYVYVFFEVGKENERVTIVSADPSEGSLFSAQAPHSGVAGLSFRISATFGASALAIFRRPSITQCPLLSKKYLCSSRFDRSTK